MSTLPKQILRGADLLTAGRRPIENAASYDITGSLDGEACVDAWKQLGEGIHGCGWLRMVAISPDGDPEVNADNVRSGAVTGLLTIKIEKVEVEGAAAYFSVDGFSGGLRHRYRQELAKVTRIVVAEAAASFATEAFRIEPWTEGCEAAEARRKNPKTSPRLVVRDNTHDNLVPEEIEPWLLRDAPDGDCPVFAAWQSAAIDRTACALASEVRDVEGGHEVIISGVGRRALGFVPRAEVDEGRLFGVLQDAAGWVYRDAREMEVRHTLLTTELSRIWTEGQTLWEGLIARLPFALESAKLAYRAHVRQTSKDTLKSLSDLRKAVADEVTKVMDQTRGLTSTLWADFSLVAAAVTVRLAAGAAIGNPNAMRPLLWVIAFYVLISAAVRLWNNDRSFVATDAILSEWHSRIYSFLPAQEFNDLVKGPIRQARDTYTMTAILVLFVYMGLAALLILTAQGLLSPDTVATAPKA